MLLIVLILVDVAFWAAVIHRFGYATLVVPLVALVIFAKASDGVRNSNERRLARESRLAFLSSRENE